MYDETLPFIPPPIGVTNGGQPGGGGYDDPGAARSGPPSPYWQAQGTPYPSSAPGQGPAGWPTTPTTPHTYPATYPNSAPSWVYGNAQPAPPTMGGYVPWVGGQAVSGSSPGGSWGPRTPGEGAGNTWGTQSPWSAPVGMNPGGGGGGGGTWGTPSGGVGYESSYVQPAYLTAQSEVDANGFPLDRHGRSSKKNKKERNRSHSRHRRNSSSHRPRFDLTVNDNGGDASDWNRDSAFAGALRRSNSQGAMYQNAHYMPQHVHRSISWGNEPTHDAFFSSNVTGAVWDPNMLSVQQMGGVGEHLPPYLKGDVYDENNLAKRPRDWRADYVPRQGLGAGLANLVLGKGRSDVRDFSDNIKRTLSSHLLYQPQQPPFTWDMTTTPFEASPIHFNTFTRPLNSLDMAQMACQPPTPTMRIYHPRLPWYIDIVARHTNGITVVDVFEQMHRQLHTPILGRHFWNDELGHEERGEITRAFVKRCAGQVEKVRRGVVQLDFLASMVVFEGLVRGSKGMWEMKMGRVEDQRREY